MKLIVGLGNPGKQYYTTRHNIGFLVADTLQKTFTFPTFQIKSRFQAEISENFVGLHRTLLIKPQTYMNLSGETVSSLLSFYKLPTKDILVVHDDIDIPWGTYKYTQDSRSAGHRGVQNIIEKIGTQKFPRLRIGVGPRPENIPTEQFVLTPLGTKEVGELSDILTKIVQVIPEYLDARIS